METPTSVDEDRAWYERRGARRAWIAVLAVGVVLLGIGGFGLVSARMTNDDSQVTKDHLAALQVEAAGLDQQRARAEEEADAVTAEASSLEDATRAVMQAALDLENTFGPISDSANAMVDCGRSDLASYRLCTRTELETFASATARLQEGTAHLRDEIAKLRAGLE